jgi:pimeloyl-ACP methyl ester carboxylesterase
MFTPQMVGVAAWQQMLCAMWPHAQGASGVVRSAAPILFLNGSADPTDPPANVAAATRTMPNALLVAVPGGLPFIRHSRHQRAPDSSRELPLRGHRQ